MSSSASNPSLLRCGGGAMPRAGVLLLSVLVAGPVLASPSAAATPDNEATPAARPDPWGPLKSLEGTWQGSIEGKLGSGTGRRHYEFVLDGLYLVQKHASVRPPQEKSPKGDHHRELAVFSFDRERERIVMRTFMVEGYVVRSPCAVAATSVVCTSESVESGPGIRARLTLTMTNPYRFEETYELAFPGKELEVYFTNTWTRIPDLGH